MFNFFKKKRIYLDYASKTPLDKRVLSDTLPFLGVDFSNPSAIYWEGINSKELLQKSRKEISHFLKVNNSEIFFTSGGTESNNLALLGTFEYARSNGFKKPHIITTEIEHPAILKVCEEIEKRGGEVTYLPVSEEGLVSIQDIENSVKENTILISIMYANNEIGTVQPIKEIGRKIREIRKKNSNYPLFHSDACQGASYLSLDVSSLGLDMMTIDGIKIYGPSGIGILYKKNNVKIFPIMYGGGQENGLRSGTENIFGIVGISKALEISEKIKSIEVDRLTKIRDYAISKILSNFPNSSLNGSKEKRLPNNINICFKGLDSEFAVIKLDTLGFSVSSASACNNIFHENSSAVIKSIGKNDCSSSSLRFTLGRNTKKSDIDKLVIALKSFVK